MHIWLILALLAISACSQASPSIHPAAQTGPPQVAIDVRLEAIENACNAQRSMGRISNGVAWARCYNKRLEQYAGQISYQHMDLLRQGMENRIEVASHIDAGELTVGEGNRMIETMAAKIADEQRRRDAALRQSQPVVQ